MSDTNDTALSDLIHKDLLPKQVFLETCELTRLTNDFTFDELLDSRVSSWRNAKPLPFEALEAKGGE